VIEVDEVVLRVQRRVHQVADDVRVLRDLDPERVLDRAHRCQRVHAVHTPQMRSTNAHASRGFAALEDDSRPRHIVPVDTALRITLSLSR